jgi:hypothetical protein
MTFSSLRFSLRTALFAGITSMALVAVGCDGGVENPDAGPDPQVCPANSRVCDNDRLCGGGFCDFDNDGDGVSKAEGDLLGCCVRVVCITDADCSQNEKCDVRRGLCVPEGLCDPAAERGGTCNINGVDQPCCGEGQLCAYTGGLPQCLANPPAAASCVVAAGGRTIATAPGDTESAPAISRAGQPIQLEAIGLDAAGKNVAHAAFTWSGTGVAAATGILTGDCAAGVCPITVTATTGAASCTGVVNVYAAPTLPQRIVVLDLDTGRPLNGVDVAARVAGVVVPGTTDANGAAEFAAAADNISAFPATHQWHTVVDPPADVVIYTARLPDDSRVAGVKGTFDFSRVHTQGDIKLGLAGTAISSSITDLNFATLIGDIADYNVELEGLTDPGGQLVPLPSGLVIGLGDQEIKGDYVAFGEPGRNIAWAIGGKVRLADIGPIISSVTASDDINIGSILGGVLPFFARFDHAIVSGLNLVEGNRPPDPGNDQPIPFAQWPFPVQSIQPNTLLAQSASYNMPDLPCTPGGVSGNNCVAPAGAGSPFATGAVLLTGVIVPGIGLVPLGLTAGLDDPDDQDANNLVDGKLDSDQPNGPGKGQAIIDYAPPHDGLEGNLFVSVAIALDLNSIADTDASSFGASIITHVTRKFAGANTFPKAFLQSQGGTFRPGQAGSFTHAATGAGASFFRVNFDDGGDTEWNVWFDNPNATFEPSDFHPNPAAAAPRLQHADIQAFALGTGYEAISTTAAGSFDALFGFNGSNLDNLLYYLGAWASEACKAGGHCEELAP